MYIIKNGPLQEILKIQKFWQSVYSTLWRKHQFLVANTNKKIHHHQRRPAMSND